MGKAEEIDVWLVSNGKYWKAAWRDADGRPGSKSLGPKADLTRREARVRCRRIGAELSRPKAAAGVPRLSAWLDRYAGQRADVSDKTRATYRYCGVYLRLFFADDPPIDRITRAQAAEWRAAVAGGGLTERLNLLAAADPVNYRNPASGRAWVPPGPDTVAQFVRTAKLIFGAAAEQELIPSNPFAKLKGTAPRSRKDWRQVTPADLSRILDACPSPPWRCLFALCRLAGLRVGECRRLRWQDVDWDGNRLAVNATAATATTKVRPRVCPIEPEKAATGLTAVLREAWDAAAEGSAGPCDGVPVNNLYKKAAGILARAGVGTYAKPFHTLRKNREAELAGAYPQYVVCEWIGHGITVSAEHYLRVPEELFASPQRVANLDAGLDASRGRTAETEREAGGSESSEKPKERRDSGPVRYGR